MPENTINIALAADNNYAKYMGLTILSVLKNADKRDKLAFYILENQISQENKQQIASLRKFKPFSIHWIDVNPDNFKQCTVTQKGLSITTYARFLIPDKIPCAKVLYLDCDILVRSSLAPLFNIDMGDNIVGGVIDINIDSKYYKKHLGERVNHYINAGVLLINNDLWRKYAVREWLFDYAVENSARLKYNDQDAINYVCAGRKYILPYEWNVMDTFYYPDLIERCSSQEDIIHAALYPKIRHCKPFKKNYFGPHKEEYRLLMQESPWKDIIPKDYEGAKLYLAFFWEYIKVYNFFFLKKKVRQRIKNMGFLPPVSNR